MLSNRGVQTASVSCRHAGSPENDQLAEASAERLNMTSYAGLLIVNADDWGHDIETTDRTLECILQGTVSSVSAMVFMSDSERAAGAALANGIDAGLHLNLTTPFSDPEVCPQLLNRQQQLSRYLTSNRFSKTVFHPGLHDSFKRVVAAQFDEFKRLFGKEPTRIDGHHHMHLCANVIFGDLLPGGAVVRRNCTFDRGEKGWCNRLYRRSFDRLLERRFRIVDYVFTLPPIRIPGRLDRIFTLASDSVVELETHPIMLNERSFLQEELLHRLGDTPIASRFASSKRIAPRLQRDKRWHT